MIKKTVTMSDIAKIMNVSTVTVSKALGGREGVSEALREKIKRKAAEMGYRSRAASRTAGNGLTRSVGVIVDKRFIGEPSAFYPTIYKNIVEQLQTRNYYCMLEAAGGGNGTYEVPSMVADKKADGLIILGQLSDSFISKLASYYIPMVFLDYYAAGEDADAVLPDNFYGAYLLTSHIIANGHRKIAFLGTGNSAVRDRFLGYYKALLENRITLRQDWLINGKNAEGEQLTEFSLPGEMPTAFVCGSDECAFHLVNQLKNMGIRVPRDVSVAGYDNHIYSTMCNPHLTTVDVDAKSLAKEAVDILLSKINGGERKHGRILVTGKLIVRDSVRNLFS